MNQRAEWRINTAEFNGKSQILTPVVINVTAVRCYEAHTLAVKNWEHGFIKNIWNDEDGTLCIRYADGKWWHYAENNNEIIWW